MYLYRDMSYEEFYKELYGGKSNYIPNLYSNLVNTFHYRDNMTSYIHFFKYAQHAQKFINVLGRQMIVKCDIPDELIEEQGFGFYDYNGIDVAPIPEYIIKVNNFLSKYMVDINPTQKGYFLFGIKDAKLYDTLMKELYRDWKKNNVDSSNILFKKHVVDFFKNRDLDDVLEAYQKLCNERKKIKIKKY